MLYSARRTAFLAPLLLLLALGAKSATPPPEGSSGFRTLTVARAERQMVATANPLASAAGLQILRDGGSAVDAAIAAALVLNLVEPQSAGIGGGGFLLTYDGKTRKVRSYDGRETAPAAVDPNQFLDPAGKPLAFPDAVVGGSSVGTPGLLRMFELAHRRSGRLPWRSLFAPAIALARSGFAVSPRLNTLIGGSALMLSAMPAAAAYFLPGGAPAPVGTKLTNPAFADVLEAVASQGADAFYEGPIAADVALAVERAPRRPGSLRASDLARYRAIERAPVCSRYGERRVCSMGPPTSGGLAVLQILALLDGGPAVDVHRFAEASKLAFADRDRYVADSDFVRVPRLLDPAYLRGRRALIGERAQAPGAGTPPGATRTGRPAGQERPSTTHLCVVDSAGDAVSMTASIENAFGSGVMVRGFLLNNQLTDFAFAPTDGGVPVANRIEPLKRPRSSMAPVIVLDRRGRFEIAVGSAGGARIIPFVAWSLLGMLDRGLDPQAALSLPHVSSRGGPTELETVPGQDAWLAEARAALEAHGHTVVAGEMNSGMQAIRRTATGLEGGVDPRREGLAIGD